jgi:hypothetical protein
VLLDRLSSGGVWRDWGGSVGVRDRAQVAGGQWADSLSVSLEGRSEDPCLGGDWDPLEI